MARVTLRLPDSLHDTLVKRAQEEGVSMNQYLVYALTQVSTADDVNAQRARFEELRHRFPTAEAEDALQALLNTRT